MNAKYKSGTRGIYSIHAVVMFAIDPHEVLLPSSVRAETLKQSSREMCNILPGW